MFEEKKSFASKVDNNYYEGKNKYKVMAFPEKYRKSQQLEKNEALYSSSLTQLVMCIQNGMRISKDDLLRKKADTESNNYLKNIRKLRIIHGSKEKIHLQSLEVYDTAGSNVTSKNKTVRKKMEEERRKQQQIIQIFKKYGKKTPINGAAKEGNLKFIKLLVEYEKMDINTVGDGGITPIIMAAWANKPKVVEYLLTNKYTDVNVANNAGLTPFHWAATKSHFEIMKLLINDSRTDLCKVDANGKTPIHVAAQVCDDKHMDIIESMLNRNFPGFNESIKATDRDETNALHAAKGKSFEQILKNASEKSSSGVYAPNDTNGKNDVMDDDILEYINIDFQSSIDISSCSIYNSSQTNSNKFYNAEIQCLNDSNEIVASFSLKSNSCTQSFGCFIGENGRNVLHAAATARTMIKDDVWDILINEIPNSNRLLLTYDSYGQTPLLLALNSKAPLFNVKKLLNRSSIMLDVFDNSTKVTTPHHFASSQQYDRNFLKELNELRPEATQLEDNDGNKPFMLLSTLYGDLTKVKATTSVEEINYILENDKDALTRAYSSSVVKQVKKKYGNEDELEKAAALNNIEDCKILIDSGNDINAVAFSHNNNTPLVIAASKGHLNVCKLLLSQTNIDVNKCGMNGRSALLMSSWNGHRSVVELLCMHPDIEPSLTMTDDTKNDAMTPLKKAKSGSIKTIIKMRIDRGTVDSDRLKFEAIRNEYLNYRVKGSLPLHYAINAGCPKYIIEQLAGITTEEKNITILSPNKNMDSAMHLLLKHARASPSVRLKNIKNNCYLTVNDDNDETTNESHVPIYSNAQDRFGDTIDIIKLRNYYNNLYKDIKIKYDNSNEIVKAAKAGNLEDCMKLLEAGEDVNLKSYESDNTPLTRAAAYGHFEICKLLVEQPDIDVNKGGYLNRTPLLMCSMEGHKDIVELLLNHPQIGPSLKKEGDGGNTPLSKAANAEIRNMIQTKIDFYVENGKSFEVPGKATTTNADLGHAGYVALKSIYGKYVTAHPNGGLDWKATKIGENEKFELVPKPFSLAETGKAPIAFRAVKHGGYLSIHPKTGMPYLNKIVDKKLTKSEYFHEGWTVAEKMKSLMQNLDDLATSPFLAMNSNLQLPIHLAIQSTTLPSEFIGEIFQKTKQALDRNQMPVTFLSLPPLSKFSIGLDVSVHSKKLKNIQIGKKYKLDRYREDRDQFFLSDPITKEVFDYKFKSEDLVKYMSHGTLLHALLDKKKLDQKLFKELIKTFPEMCSIKNDCGIYPVQVASENNHHEEIIKLLWATMKTGKSGTLALKCHLFEEAKHLFVEKDTILSTENLFLCIDTYKKIKNKSLGGASDLVDIVKSLIERNPSSIVGIPCDFEARENVNDFLSMIYNQEESVDKVLKRNLDKKSVYKYMQDWYKTAKLSRILGDPEESKLLESNTISMTQLSTWGSRGFLFKTGKIYYECTVVRQGTCAQIGWVDKTFKSSSGYSSSGVGELRGSWGVDGVQQLGFFNGETKEMDDLQWTMHDVIGIAIDLDGTNKSFHVSVNGKWIYDVVDNMEYTVGLFPAITSENGEYSINFGQTNMMFNAPHDDYRTLLEAMKHESCVKGVVTDCLKKYHLFHHKLTFRDGANMVIRRIHPSKFMKMVKHAAPSKKQDRIVIDESDRLLFTKYKEQDPWQPNSTKYIRLRPTRFEKLGDDDRVSDIKVAEKDDSGEILIEGFPNMKIHYMNIAIDGTALHYLVSEGIFDPESIDAILFVMGSMVVEKDGLGRLPIEIAAAGGNLVFAKRIWYKMVAEKVQTLTLALRARLWKEAEELIESYEIDGKLLEKLNATAQDDNTDHAIHLAAKYGAPVSVLKKLIEAEESMIMKEGKWKRNILHYLAEADGQIDTVKYILNECKEGPTLLEMEDQFKMIPLHYATALRARKDIVEAYLIKSKERDEGRLDHKDHIGLKPVHWIVHQNRMNEHKIKGKPKSRIVDLVSVFQANGVDINTATVFKEQKGFRSAKYNFKPLHLALKNNLATSELVEMFLLHAEQQQNTTPRIKENVPGTGSPARSITSPNGINGQEGGRSGNKEDDMKGYKIAETLHLAARYVTNEAVVKKIAESFESEIQIQDDINKMTPLHYAALYNRNPNVVAILIDAERQYIQRKKQDSKKWKIKLFDLAVARPDNLGFLPIHHAATSRFATVETIKNLDNFYRSYDGNKDDSRGGSDIANKSGELPLHLAVKASSFRNGELYSNIILELIKMYPGGMIETPANALISKAPLQLALDPENTNRLKKLNGIIVRKMLKSYMDSKQSDIPTDIDLSYYCAINKKIFETFVSDFKLIFMKSGEKNDLRKSNTWGDKLIHHYPYLFKGNELMDTNRNDLLWRYWFYMQASIFEGVEVMKLQEKDIPCGLSNLVKTIDKFSNQAVEFEDYQVIDAPLAMIKVELDKTNNEDNEDDNKWLMSILEKVDPAHNFNKAAKHQQLFPDISSPLTYAIRCGCVQAIIALSEGGCNPVHHSFSKVNGLHWDILPYDIANCVGSLMDDGENKDNWEVGMDALRKNRDTDKYRKIKACKRLFSFSKLPLELITIIIMLIIGVMTTTGAEKGQLRWGKHISDKFVDEEFDPEDSHIFKNFFDIASIEEFWQWANGPLMGGLYSGEGDINGREAIDEVSVLVGSVRIRSLRVKPERCKNFLGVDKVSLPANGCHSDRIQRGTVNIEPFGPVGNEKKYQYFKPNGLEHEANMLGDRLWQERYPSGGHTLYLPGGNSTRAAEIMAELMEDGFVSTKDGTRLVAFEFSIYNNHIDKVISMRLMVEFWVGGGTHSNFDATIINFDNRDSKFLKTILQTILLVMFTARLVIEIDEIAWGSLRSLSRSIRAHAPPGTSKSDINDIIDVDSIKKTGLHLGKYVYKPFIICKKKDTKIKLKKSNTTNSNKISAHEKLEGGIKQVIAANNVIGAMASEEELRAKAANSGVRVSPFHPAAVKEETIGMKILHTVGSIFAEIQIRVFVFINFNILYLCGTHMVMWITKPNILDPVLKGESFVGLHNNFFDLYWDMIFNNKYWFFGWNYFEWILVGIYFFYYSGNLVYGHLQDMLRLQLVEVLRTGEEKFIPLDRLSWINTHTQDLVAVLFVLVVIHLLRTLQEIPFGIGARIMAIIRVVGHKNIVPFYFTMIVFLFSFAMGYHFAFANELEEYRGVGESLVQMMTAAIGDFGIGIDEMLDSALEVTYILLFLTWFFVTLLLMNIFIGVVSMVYEETEEKSLEDFDKNLDEYMREDLTELDRGWAKSVIYNNTFEECVLHDVSEDAAAKKDAAELPTKVTNLEKRMTDEFNVIKNLIKAIE